MNRLTRPSQISSGPHPAPACTAGGTVIGRSRIADPDLQPGEREQQRGTADQLQDQARWYRSEQADVVRGR